jgi:hypothetical protein
MSIQGTTGMLSRSSRDTFETASPRTATPFGKGADGLSSLNHVQHANPIFRPHIELRQY